MNQTVLGNKAAPHLLRMVYDGGEEHMVIVHGLADQLMNKYPGMFQINIYIDKTMAGKLDVRLCLNSKDENNEGIPIITNL